MLYLQGILAVTKRHLLVWKAMFFSSFALYTLEPLLVLFAFGFGLGQAFETMGGLPYIQYVVPGMMISAAMYAVAFDAAYGSFLRRVFQKTYDAMLASPLNVQQITFGEILYAMIRAMFPASIVCAVGAYFGGVGSITGVLIALAIIALTGACIFTMILSYASRIKLLNRIDFMMPMFLTPQFLFCGVFIERSMFPDWVQALAQIFPLTHAVNLIRPLVSNQSLSADVLLTSLSYLIIVTAFFTFYSIRGLKKALTE